MRQIARILMLLLLGALVGGILGSIFTGDWIYTIVWAGGLPLLIMVAGFVGSRSARTAGTETPPGRGPGIIGSLRGLRDRTAGPVLNPESTAVPATGTILNGVPVEPADAGGSGGPPVPSSLPVPPSSRTPWWNRALAILIIAAGAALVLIPAYRMIGWTVSDLAQGRWDGKDMRSGLHQQEAIDDIAAVVGGYEFTWVGFYDSYVLVDAPTFPGADTTDTFEWRYGRAWRQGPEFIQPTDIDAERFDASSIDFSIVATLVEQAKRDTGFTDIESWYPSVSRWSGGAPEISISIGSAYHDAYYRFSVEGELLERNGTD